VLSACVDKSQLISRIPLADTCRILQREFAFLEPSSLGNRKTVGEQLNLPFHSEHHCKRNRFTSPINLPVNGFVKCSRAVAVQSAAFLYG
jgi:hypothetical protein